MTFHCTQGSLSVPVLIATLVTLSACGPRFDASASTKGSKVSVYVRKLKAGDEVRIQGFDGATATAKLSHAIIDIPAEKVGAGEHELTVEVTRGNKKKAKKISVSVPESALAPFLRVTSCTRQMKGKYSNGSVKVQSKAWPASSVAQSCMLTPSGTIELQLSANADAVVKAGDTPVELDHAVGTAKLPITPVLHRLSLRGVGDSKASGEFPLEVQLTSTRGGNTVSYPLEAKVEMRAIRSALFDSLLAMDGGKPATWPRSAHDGKARGAALVVKAHPVKVDGKEQTVRNSAYSGVLVAGDEHKTDEIDLYAVATPSDVTNRGACRGYVTISGAGGVRNTGFVMGFDVKVFDHSGKQVAEKSFPRPKKTRCPTTLSGTQGKTTILVWAPNKSDVQKWLDGLVN